MADITKAQPTVKKKKFRWSKDDSELTVLALPATALYVVFCYLPMIGIIMAFKDYKLGGSFLENLFVRSKWCGFENFQYFLRMRDFPQMLRNTILYNVVFIALGVLLPVTLAIMISNIYSKRKSKLYQTLMIMPHFMSWVVCSYFVYAFINGDKGLLNGFLRMIGKEGIDWYNEPKYWPYILTFLQVWKTVGNGMIVYLATITGIDSTLYEAAVLDGASKFQQARYVTLPSLKPIIIMMFIMSLGSIFSTDIGLFYVTTRGANQPLTPMVATFDVKIYQMLQDGVSFSKSTAASVFKSAIGCVTILGANAIVRKVDESSALI